MPVQPISFTNDSQQRLLGMWHSPEGDSGDKSAPPVVVMLHGWSGYRTGPHQMLTRAARVFAAHGFGVLRFDFAGRGDSDGNAAHATLATMARDTRAALRWCEERGYTQVVLLGLCSGCEVAFAAASEESVTALALWSAPVFAAGQGDEAGAASAAGKRADNLKKYARKLLRPETWRKILTGSVDTASVKKAVGQGGGETHRNSESGEAGHLPPGWRSAALNRFEKTDRPRLMIYGTADPTTEEALAWHRARGRTAPEVHFIDGANHSFYGLAWEKEVIEITALWLKRLESIS